MSRGQGPSISFVVVARNDDYGGDFVGRMQRFVDRLGELLVERSASAELVIVEWNPPTARPPIRDAVKWSRLTPSVTVRVIEVPYAIHAQLPNSDRMPVFEYIGKNVGIRRARGAFVVATNPDLLYPRRLINLLFSDRLDESRFYRANRLDVVDRDGRRVAVRLQTRYGAFSTSFPYVTPANARRVAGFMKQWAVLLPHWPPHTVASGDFLMMSTEAWHGLRGYPEIPTHSFIDGYMCYIAKSAGLKEKTFRRAAIEHLEHPRDEQSMRPLTDITEYRTRCRAMLRNQTPWQPNGTGWGLGDEQLPEASIP